MQQRQSDYRGATVVRITNLRQHPAREHLAITNVLAHDGADGIPVVVRKDEYRIGDLAVYTGVDAIVPVDRARFSFLDKRGKGKPVRVKAAKIGGVYSEGVLTTAMFGDVERVDDALGEGSDLSEVLGVTKYDPEAELERAGRKGGSYRSSGTVDGPHDVVYELGALRTMGRSLFKDGERVIAREKMHGCNFRAMHDGERLHVGSIRNWKACDDRDLWWRAALQYQLDTRLAEFPGVTLFGEVFGDVQDLKYGAAEGQIFLVVFDILDSGPALVGSAPALYLDEDQLRVMCLAWDLPMAPLVYDGTWPIPLPGGAAALADGLSLWPGAQHLREGVVIRSADENRRAAKVVSEAYKLR